MVRNWKWNIPGLLGFHDVNLNLKKFYPQVILINTFLTHRTKIEACLPFWQEYKISSFEQRLMNEIEFRLERTPVDESDDEIQHDEIPTGKCIAPIFDKRLKHFRVTEGSPVTFTCKIVGIPVPKVGEDDQPFVQPTAQKCRQCLWGSLIRF